MMQQVQEEIFTLHAFSLAYRELFLVYLTIIMYFSHTGSRTTAVERWSGSFD